MPNHHNNHSLTLSIAISLLLHLFVFLSIGFLLLLQPAPLKEVKKLSLQVRLAQPRPPKVQSLPGKKLLTSPINDSFKVAAAAAPPAPAIDPATPAAEQITGIALPGSIPTPFPLQGRANNSLFQARSAQQDAARAYYQQVQEARERQRTEFQAQLVMQHLHQILVKVLDVQPLVSGKCELVESDNVQPHRLKCDSSALYETISNDQKNVVDLLTALRGMGRNFNGFSVGEEAGKPRATLINTK